MKLKTLCEAYKSELHYNPERALRKTELAIQHTKEQIESIKQNIDPKWVMKVKNEKGEIVIPKSEQEKIKYWKGIIKEHEANIAKWEKEAEKFKELIKKQKINEELNENLKTAGKAIVDKTTQFIKNRAKSVKQRLADDRARVEQAEQQVKNLKNVQNQHSSISGKDYMDDEAAIERAEKKARAVKKSTVLSKLRRRSAIILACIVLLSNMMKPFTNPNLLMSEMNINTIERRLTELDGVIAEREPEVLNSINDTEYLQGKYDEFKEEFNSIKFNENGKPATSEDAEKLNNLAYKIAETTDKAIMKIDGKTTDNVVKGIYRGFGNLWKNAKEIFKNIKFRINFGDRFNPRGNK